MDADRAPDTPAPERPGAVNFDRLDICTEPIDGEPPEAVWLTAGHHDQARAWWWTATPRLVAPTSYRRHQNLDAVMADFAARGLPVRLRRSGGGVVPQGPGIWNLSLVYPLAAGPGAQPVAVYEHLCGVLRRALAALDIETRGQEVRGSFCDGRFNLAVRGEDGAIRKICGIAQYWKRQGARHAVLAHALVLIDGNLDRMTNDANAFEDALCTGRRYDADALTSVALEWRAGPSENRATVAIAQRLGAAIGAALRI